VFKLAAMAVLIDANLYIHNHPMQANSSIYYKISLVDMYRIHYINCVRYLPV
jgi:hypothetical protein